MGPKIIKIIVYPILFIITFMIFLYLLFPYENLKDRIIGVIENQVGGGMEVEIDKFSSYWFTGVKVEGLTIRAFGADKSQALINCKKAHARASFSSLIFGNPSFSFYAQMDKGEVSGRFKQTEDSIVIDADLDDFDIGSLKFLKTWTGLQLSSKISGSADLRVDKQNASQSTGKISLDLSELKIAASEAKIGEMNLPLPDLLVATGRDSKIKLMIEKGTVTVDNFKFAGGDIGLDVKGKIFLSNKPDNYRMNLSGSFTPSKKMSDALPFLFIVEQQKQSDGSYPLSVTGRLVQPSIKVGSFTVPM